MISDLMSIQALEIEVLKLSERVFDQVPHAGYYIDQMTDYRFQIRSSGVGIIFDRLAYPTISVIWSGPK